MSNFGKLVNFEFRRFLPIFLPLVGILVLSQVIGAIVFSMRYLSDMERYLIQGQRTTEDFILEFGKLSMMEVVNSIYFMGPIGVAVVSLLIYLLFIWYRDWIGKNTFAYRLLTLPTNRLNLFFSKASTIFIFIFGFITIQLIMMPILQFILKLFVPVDYRLDMALGAMVQANYFLSILLPQTISGFFIHYGLGIVFTIGIFTMVLLERSYRLIGIGFAFLYAIIVCTFIFTPYYFQYFFHLYTHEAFWLETSVMIIISVLSIWLSSHLLNNKIRV
ncbi:hypothetical protein M3E13_14185 [Oceanobacillus kimchii]|uniref:ABC transporter permease n=1 Tax=Oceanobacillus kimchii TaxID=746691 RepID=A0ABQ5TFT9_9BACI|nr:MULTISPECIES: hypothetical protein [Oceanobacillus]MCT1577437.1 hypothetical protein [Oceanobacillus kimchii]MCT2137043.1 hypothetical protein [Oceanobacillus kimchii]OEH53638.1 hypothetical protein AQ616_14190 [Oceanobacillus sp. E9]GLO64845.1 hypothetical protein MACH08_06290 [Oceanobacillus kimchii]